MGALIVSSCSKETSTSQEQPPAPATAPIAKTPIPKPAPKPPKVELSDDQRAAALWAKINGFKSWSNPPGFQGLVEGDSVHGDYVRIYANSTAISNMANLPNGSIVVKEGFHDDQGDLKAITVMEKIDGYSEESGDWFFSRFDTSGKPSKVNSSSCIRCHRKADGDDFSFAND